jgi:hypothetical protein
MAWGSQEANGIPVTVAAPCVEKLSDHDLWLAGFKDSEDNHGCQTGGVRPSGR